MTLSANHIDYTLIEDHIAREDFAYSKVREFPFSIKATTKNGMDIFLYGFTNENDAHNALDYIDKRSSSNCSYVAEHIIC